MVTCAAMRSASRWCWRTKQGTVLDLTSELRKNNTGVDWKQLFIGTSGAFGIVTECVLNLEPLPRQVATAYLVPRKRRACHAVAACDGGASRLPISRRFEGMSKNAVSRCSRSCSVAEEPIPGRQHPGLRDPRRDLTQLGRCARVNSRWMRFWRPCLPISGTATAPLADAFVGPAHEMWALQARAF